MAPDGYANATPQGALHGFRVLDLSRVLAGPWAGQLLADLGAQVVKVEHPQGGDDTRSWGPPFIKAADDETGYSAYFACANRNKQSIAINLAHPQGQSLILRLLAHCDVLLENFKVGDLQRYGLDAATVCAAHPQLVYCSISGFGQSGPRAKEAGYDFMMQGMGGLMSVTGQAGKDGIPTKVGVAQVDVMTGLYASNAILAALLARARTGRGQVIDVSLFDVQLAALANQASNYLTSGVSPGRLGNAHPNLVPYQSFATADGQVIVAVGNDSQFARLAQLLGHAEWLLDADFTSNRARVAARDKVTAAIAAVMRQSTTKEWITRLQAAQIPCGPINTVQEAFADPQAKARGAVQTLAHPVLGPVHTVANPIRLSDTAVRYEHAPPLLGQDTDMILAQWLGASAEDLLAWRQAQVIA